MSWIIRPLPEFAEAFRRQTQVDFLRLATLPPNWPFGDGTMRWIVGPGNILDMTFDTVFSFDVRQVVVTPEVIRPIETLILWPGIDDVHSESRNKPDLFEFYPEPEVVHEAPIQVVAQEMPRVKRAKKALQDVTVTPPDVTGVRLCEGCGKPLPEDAPPDKKTHNGACRTRASRLRKKRGL